MEKEKLIDDLLALLAPIIALDGKDDKTQYPQVIFVAHNMVIFDESPGIAIRKEKVLERYHPFKFLKTLWDMAIYDFQGEMDHYIELLTEEDEDAAIAFEEKGEYDPNLIPDHVYHSLRYVKEFVEAYEQIYTDLSQEQ